MQDQDDSFEGRGLSRRSAVGAAAWSIPALAVVSAAPAFATSTVGRLTIADGASASVPRTIAWRDDETHQRDVLALSNLLIAGDRASSAITLSLTVTFEPDDPEGSPLVRWDSGPTLDEGWTAEVVDPVSEGSSTGAAVRYKRGGFTGTAPVAFGTALTPSNQVERPLVSSDDPVPGRWRVRAEAAGFAPAELVLASPHPSGSALTLQQWQGSSVERGAGSIRASLPGGIVIPPTGLTAAYKVRYTLRFVGSSVRRRRPRSRGVRQGGQLPGVCCPAPACSSPPRTQFPRGEPSTSRGRGRVWNMRRRPCPR